MTRGEDGEVVYTGEVTVEFIVRAWLIDGEDRYDWLADTGQDSDDLFESIEDATYDARSTLGG